jgi:hypothetical protein
MPLNVVSVGTFIATPIPSFLSRLILADIRDVERVDKPRGLDPDIRHELPVNVIKFRSGATLHYLRFPAKEGAFTEVQSESADGIGYTTSISIVVPNNTPELLAWLNKMAGRRWLTVWELRGNPGFGFAGEPGNGMRLLHSRAHTDVNQVVFNFEGRYAHPSFYLTDAPNPNPGAGFSSGFSWG